jgi:hypothetical protein
MKNYANNRSSRKYSPQACITRAILEWSYGEVTKPETINYRTQRLRSTVSSTSVSLDQLKTTNVTVRSTVVFATRVSSVRSVELKSLAQSYVVNVWATSNSVYRCHTSGSSVVFQRIALLLGISQLLRRLSTSQDTLLRR